MKSKGFTLIELLVVVSIIGVLATVMISSFGDSRNKAKDTVLLKDAKELQTAVETFYSFEGRLPTSGTTVNGGGYYIATYCADAWSGFQDNWTDFITDMGDYLPDHLHPFRSETPFCVYYMHGNHPSCDEETGSEYNILFFAHTTPLNGLDDFISGYPESNPGHCLYPV